MAGGDRDTECGLLAACMGGGGGGKGEETGLVAGGEGEKGGLEGGGGEGTRVVEVGETIESMEDAEVDGDGGGEREGEYRC